MLLPRAVQRFLDRGLGCLEYLIRVKKTRWSSCDRAIFLLLIRVWKPTVFSLCLLIPTIFIVLLLDELLPIGREYRGVVQEWLRL